MATKKSLSEVATLEQYRIAFENVKNSKDIAKVLMDFGYNKANLAIGKDLLIKTRKAFDFNKKKYDKTLETYKNFKSIKERLSKIYMLDRKKAKIIFRKDTAVLSKLELIGSLAIKYINWLETVKNFYTIISTDIQLQEKLARLKITNEKILSAVELIANLEVSRATYLREKGEAQAATKLKDKSFLEIDDWMSEFYAIAKIALEENPQLLESLGKFVRS